MLDGLTDGMAHLVILWFELEEVGDGSILACVCQKANSWVRCLFLYSEAEYKKQANPRNGV